MFDKFADFGVALDLDGTCLNEKGESGRALIELLEEIENSGLLIYATGRSHDSAINSIVRAGLPLPRYLVSDVGNRAMVRNGNSFFPDEVFETFNSARWLEIGDMATSFDPAPDAALQAGTTLRRVGYWATSEAGATSTADALRRREILRDRSIIRWDGPTMEGKWWIDVLPGCGGKGTAVSYIAFKEGIPNFRMMAVGDSLNDADLLDGRFFSGVPANATPRLVSQCRGLNEKFQVESACGPEGTEKFLRKSLAAIRENRKPPGFPNEADRLEKLRQGVFSPEIISILGPWPDRLRNWGIRPGNGHADFENTREKTRRNLDRCRNWWWASSTDEEKERILDRFSAVPGRFIFERLCNFISGKNPNLKILGGMVSGSYLYRPDSVPARDLDMVLFLDGMEKPEIGFEVDFPGLRNAFPEKFRARLSTDRIGFGIVDRGFLTAQTDDPTVLQIVSSMEGSGIPLFGGDVSGTPMPAFDLLAQAWRLLQDGVSNLRSPSSNKNDKVFLRVREAVNAASLALKKSGIADSESGFLEIPGLEGSARDSASLLKIGFKVISRSFLTLVDGIIRRKVK